MIGPPLTVVVYYRFGRTHFQREGEIAWQSAAGIRAADPADLLVGGQHEIDVSYGTLLAVSQQARRLQEGGHRCAVVQEVAPEVVADIHQRPLASVHADAGARAYPRGRQLLGGVAGEDVDGQPVQGFVALVGLGFPDLLTLLRRVLRAQRQHSHQRLLVPKHGDRAEAEVARIHRPQRRHAQRATGLHPLDDHRHDSSSMCAMTRVAGHSRRDRCYRRHCHCPR